MKKLSIVLVFILSLSLLILPASANSLGDVDGSGVVDTADARLALRIAVDLEKDAAGSPRYTAADVDFSGAVDTADARTILRAAVGLQKLPSQYSGKTLTSKEIYKLASNYTFEIRVSTAEYSAIGSGFAISADGLIVTNYHVVQDAETIQVFDLQNREYTVKQVVAVDRKVDLAILRVKGTLTPAKLNTADYETGDTVYTLGSANGYTGTFANGVISNAAVDLPDFNPYVTYVQTSAPISGGNSGGPLIDEKGRVVAVNTLTDEQGQNLNFAIPSSYILALDRSHPMTVKEFAKAELEYRDLDLLFGERTVSLRKGAAASYVLSVVSRQDYTLQAKCSSDQLKVIVRDNPAYGYAGVHVIANGECKNAVVTVFFKEAPDVKLELRVTVSPKGEIGYMGTEGAPDFGAVTGVAPKAESFTSSDPYDPMEYDGAKLLKSYKSAKAVREAYEKALTAAGYSLASKDSQLLSPYVTYYYTNAKTGITLAYTENTVLGILRSVTIMLY